MPPCINVTISIIINLQYNFPKMRGGSKAVWNFSKKSSNLVAGPFPNLDVYKNKNEEEEEEDVQGDRRATKGNQIGKFPGEI